MVVALAEPLFASHVFEVVPEVRDLAGIAHGISRLSSESAADSNEVIVVRHREMTTL